MDSQDTRSHIIRWLYAPKASITASWCDFNQARHLLEPTDVVLIDANTLADRKIKAISGSRWSQAYLYIGRLHDIRNSSLRAAVNEHLNCQSDTQLMLKVDLVKGIHITTISELRQQTFRICRPRGLSEEDKQSVINYAISRMSPQAKHAWWPAVRLMLVPWRLLSAKWRLRMFRYLSGRRLRRAVGGTVGDAFSFIQFPILPLVKGEEESTSKLYRQYPFIFFAADFDLSPYFDVVKYPFIGDVQKRVRLQAWDGHLGSLEGQELVHEKVDSKVTAFK